MTELAGALDCRRIPEHSTGLLTALGGGSHFEIDGFLFCHDADWLTAVGYPRSGPYDAKAFEVAIKEAVLRTGAIDIFAIAPFFLDRRTGSIFVEYRHGIKIQ